MIRTRRRGPLSGRSTAEWGIRGGLALAAVALGYASVTYSLADLIKRTDPARAHDFAPGNGQIAALLSEKRFSEDTSPVAQGAIERLAMRAIRQDPTAVSAVTTLGFQAQLRGDAAATRRLFTYSQMLTRRHLQTQLWAIEDAVSRGDVARVLEHYDIALRTSKTAPDLLFPVLSSAIADPGIRSGLVATLAKRPAWAPPFISYVAISRKNLTATADLFVGLRRARIPPPPEAIATVTNQLIETGAIADAWRYYSFNYPSADRRQSRDPMFMVDPRASTKFDWTPVNDSGIAISIQQGERGGVLDFSVPAGTGGTLIQQVQVLPPGRYRLTGHSTGIEQADQLRPYWVLACNNGLELGRVPMPNSAQAGGVFAGQINVPSSCAVQLLSLIVRPSESAVSVTGQIDRVQLSPLNS